jgi:hypothetical protein
MKDIDFRDPRSEAEWRAQERGDGSYARIARAAAYEPEMRLPADFAERMAAMAHTRTKAAQAPTVLETGLIALLLTILFAAAGALLALTGRLDGVLRPSWPLGLAVCVALSLVLELLTPRRPRSAGASRFDRDGGRA